MSIRYSAGFVIFGVALAVWGIGLATVNPWSLSLLYPSLTLLLLGLAYAGAGPGLLGKQPNGLRSWLAIFWSAPFTLVNEFLWWLIVLVNREPAVGIAADKLYFGRRLRWFDKKFITAIDFQSCLDLTCEFSEGSSLRLLKNYRCLPILDGTSLTTKQLNDAIAWLENAIQRGPVYVHCALGHRRTAMVVAAYLLAHRVEVDVDGALRRLRQARRGIALSKQQRRALTDFLTQFQRRDLDS